MPSINLYENDLPRDLNLGSSIAVDTETLGLNPHRDRLCLVQISDQQGTVHLVQFKSQEGYLKASYLKELLENPKIEKIFHFGLFDIAVLNHYLGANVSSVFCTKIASKIARTYTQKHGLKDLCKNLLSVNLSKEEQTSNWGVEVLSEAQKSYAAQDVAHLHALRTILKKLLKDTHREDIASACFKFLPTRAQMSLMGWADDFVFQH